MVQPTHARNRNDLPIFARFNSPFSRSVLIKPEMGSVRVVMVSVRPDDAQKLAVIDRDYMSVRAGGAAHLRHKKSGDPRPGRRHQRAINTESYSG